MIILLCHALIYDVKCNNFNVRSSRCYLLYMYWLLCFVLACAGLNIVELWRKCRHSSMISLTGDHIVVVLHTCFRVMFGHTFVAPSSTMISVIDQLNTSCVWSFVWWLNVIHDDLRLDCENATFWSIDDLLCIDQR